MQPVRKLEIRVGLIVILAIAAAVSLVLSADRVSLERRYTFTAWLRDAGGLRERSPVTLAGIAVGSVQSIAADPASGRIRAVIAVNASIDLPRDLRARLASSGLFGDSSLALSSAGGGGVALAKDGSASIEVAPGFFDEVGARAERILDAADDLLSPASRGDLKRLLASSADLAAHAAAIAGRLDQQGGRLDAALADLAVAARELRSGAETLNRRLDPLLARADGALAGLDQRSGALAERAEAVLGRLDGVLADSGPRLAAGLDALRRALDGAAAVTARVAAGEGVLGRLVGSRELALSLDRMAVDLEDAARAVAEHPSVLVFERGEGEQRRGEARRAHEKMRRALDAGLAAEPSASPAAVR